MDTAIGQYEPTVPRDLFLIRIGFLGRLQRSSGFGELPEATVGISSGGSQAQTRVRETSSVSILVLIELMHVILILS